MVEVLAAAHERAIKAYKLRLAGKLLKQIGAELGGVSYSRALQLVAAGKKLCDREGTDAQL
jgi:hypothetical protein